MKLLCQTDKLYDSIANGEDREKFGTRYKGETTWISTIDEKTRSQLNAVWRDWDIVARLLHCKKEDVYGFCVSAGALRDFFFEKAQIAGSEVWLFKTLSTFKKIKMSEFIPRMRDFLQGVVNDYYQENVIINWSNRENMG